MSQEDGRVTGQPSRRQARLGYLKIATAAVIWGSLGVFVRSTHLPYYTILFWRVAFAMAGIFVGIILTGRARHLAVRRRVHWLYLLIAGLGLTVNWLLFFYALQVTKIATAVLLTYTAPVLTAVLAYFFLKEHIGPAVLGALAIAIGGVMLIAGPAALSATGSPAGILAALGSAFTYAGLVVFAKRIMTFISIESLLFYENVVTVLAMLAFFTMRVPLPATGLQWAMLATMGLVHTALAGTLYLSGLKSVRAQTSGILTYLDPLSATIFAAIFLAETPTALTLAGGALILVAGAIVVTKAPIQAPYVPD